MHARSWQPAAVALVAAALLQGGTCDEGASTPESEPPPGIRIDQPEDQALVRGPSFEVSGVFAGSAIDIELSIDGGAPVPALRGDEAFDWRVPARDISVAPGRHVLTAIARGEGGVAESSIWIHYEPDPSVGFRIALVPETATYEPDEPDDDPRLLLFGPENEVDLTLTAQGVPGVSVDVNRQLPTGATVDLQVNVITTQPGVYPVSVTARSDTGETMRATHTITIARPTPPPTTPPPTTAAPLSTVAPASTAPPSTVDGTAPLAVLADDFEEGDRWTEVTTESGNGAGASDQLDGGGNPGGLRRMTHELPATSDGENNPARIAVRHLFEAGWDPAVDGAIARIDYREDQIQFDPPFDGAAIGARVAIVQDGTTYLASINPDNVFRNTQWQTVTAVGLTPADFSPAPGPDFSQTGGPLSFGYLRSNTSRSATGIMTQHGIDNWSVTLYGR